MNRLLRTQGALALACGVFFAGCGGGSSPMTMSNYDKIQEGMTIEQVSEIMGFPPPDVDKTSIIPGADIMDTKNGVDRNHKPTNLDGLAYDEFHYKELGGQNKKDIFVTYENNKVTQKNQSGLE
jgi:hypothetical protein